MLKNLNNLGELGLFSLGVAAATCFTVTAPATANPDELSNPAAVSNAATRSSQFDLYSTEGKPGLAVILDQGQVTSVSQLSDVKPTDWAFQSLQSLVERYGCLVGYPDKTYRGNRALTRYEFAAGLNACMDRLTELLAEATNPLVRKEDLVVVQKLQEEFAAELATLRGRVDVLEAKTAQLEAQQFSATTKLQGVAVFALAGAATGQEPPGVANLQTTVGNPLPTNFAFGNRVRLEFVTSFTGRDELLTRIQAGNLGDVTGSLLEGDLFFAVPGGNNTAVVDAFKYTFPVGDKTEIAIVANAGASDDFSDTLNVLDGDGNELAFSTFGTRASIFYLVSGTGFGVRHEVSDRFEVNAGFMSRNAADPTPNAGLFGGSYAAMAQLVAKPSETASVALTYIYANNSDMGTGSLRSNLRSFTRQLIDPGNVFGLGGSPVSSNSLGLQFSWKVAKHFVFGGWVGYTNSQLLSSISTANFVADPALATTIPAGDVDIWNWALTFAFPDLGRKGSIAGLIVGMEPKVTAVSNSLVGVIDPDPDTSLHIEGFYQFQITDNISIAPGFIWLTAPNHNQLNDDVLIGLVRTTFRF